MGAHVKASALSDTHDVADIDALVGGRAYDKAPIISRAAFEPPLDLYLASLSKGQRICGWVVFDVPARHGQLMLRNLWFHKVAVWTY